ncbi:Protein CBG08925 [Caenorhabditis briggsae]|uniref:Protein CBG08925 n=1 Tax=Caenorhabditis briggsae TaxID=6238 RepID=A8X7P9_CAEBR|nr:Protein CBG08925 [Caenorhabditis briggsae]CAP28660.1 Protein CBG08925 [Caenorhabditis briggsae]
MSIEDVTPVVIDSGSSSIKAGFACETKPRVVISSVTGQLKKQSEERNKYRPVEKDTQLKNDILEMRSPIQRGIVIDWDGATELWENAFNNLRITPKCHPMLLTESPFTTNADREKMTEIFFETFNTPGVCFANQAIMSLFGSGRTTGIVIESGEHATHVTPIYKGKVITGAVSHLDIGGHQLTEYLTTMVSAERSHIFPNGAKLDMARQIKENIGYVVLDYELELATFAAVDSIKRSYDFGNGRAVSFGKEIFRFSEAMFKPSLVGKTSDGVPELVWKSIIKTQPDIEEALLGNICLTGGNTMLTGFKERMEHELAALIPPLVYLLKILKNSIVSGSTRFQSLRKTIASLPLSLGDLSSLHSLTAGVIGPLARSTESLGHRLFTTAVCN